MIINYTDHSDSTATFYPDNDGLYRISTNCTIICYDTTDAISNYYLEWSIQREKLLRDWNKWWDWFRTGYRQQFSRKKKGIKRINFICKNYWRKILPSKSGWVGKVMLKKKGK